MLKIMVHRGQMSHFPRPYKTFKTNNFNIPKPSAIPEPNYMQKRSFLTCEIISPLAVRTWYKYRYFLCRASSRVSRGREFDLVRCVRRRVLVRLRWFTRHAVIKHCIKTLTIIITGQMHSNKPPQHGGGSGFGFICKIYDENKTLNHVNH